MGLFGKLFEKKNCDICNGEIGLLGNRKLEDGNLCKQCAAKLSPWFDERRHSTVEQIREQLQYREQNLDEVKNFHTTRTLGRGWKVLLDEDHGKFMVTQARNLTEANPDVCDFSQVTGCQIDIDEDKDEVMRKKDDGTEESYQPRRFTYRYNFYMIINVNHPYFDTIRFHLNPESIILEDNGSVSLFGSGSNTFDPHRSPEYQEYENLANEIKEALTQVRTEVRERVAMENAPKQAKTCPYCGATGIPQADGTCEYCGGAMG